MFKKIELQKYIDETKSYLNGDTEFKDVSEPVQNYLLLNAFVTADLLIKSGRAKEYGDKIPQRFKSDVRDAYKELEQMR